MAKVNKKKSKSKRSKYSLTNISQVIVGFLVLSLICSVYLFYDLPSFNDYEKIKKQRIVTIYDQNGEVVANLGELRGKLLTINDVPKDLLNAIIATEDRRFYQHGGVDYIGIARAFVKNMSSMRIVQGGSTITQQVAKNLYLSPERSFKRKIQEVVLSFQLEQRFSKDEILEIYLNRVYMGAGIYGVSGAAHYYFDKDVAELNLNESAMLTGLLKAPSRYSPVNNKKLASERSKQVLSNMLNAGLLEQNRYEAAVKRVVNIDLSQFGSSDNFYFANYIMDQLPHLIDNTDSDLDIYTTLDTQAQNLASKLIANYVNKYGDDRNVEQGALIALSKTGEVLAMVGGKNYKESNFNRSVLSKRQYGSSFKTIVYAALFENSERQPSSITVDAPITIKGWSPKNATRTFLGEVTIAEAFARSLNSPSVRASEEAGRRNVIELAKKLGLTSVLEPNPSIALGAIDGSLFDLVSAYQPFIDNGIKYQTFAIKQINLKDSNISIYKHTEDTGFRAISSRTANYIIELLEGAVNRDYGTGKAAKFSSSVDVGGKTGTSQGARDAWFLGVTPGAVVGVWFGNDDNSPMKNISGSNLPALVFRDFASQAVIISQGQQYFSGQYNFTNIDDHNEIADDKLPWISNDSQDDLVIELEQTLNEE